MLTIGDFARLSGLSVRMLHHYDSLGLLRPDRVDAFTGYRYYAPQTLESANRIVALKELGFSLDETRQLLDASDAEVGRMLRERAQALRTQIGADTRRLAEVEARLRLLQKENIMSTPISAGALPALRLAQLTATVADPAEISTVVGPLFERIAHAVATAGLPLDRPSVATYSGDEDGTVIAAAEQVAEDLSPTQVAAVQVDGVEVVQLPAVERGLTLTHTGSLATIGESWQHLVTAAGEQGLSPVGPCREIYHRVDLEHDRDWEIELQQPVE